MAQSTRQWRDMEWDLSPKPDGTLSQEQITLSLLMDIRGLLRSIKSIAVVVVVLAAISLALSMIYAFVALGSP